MICNFGAKLRFNENKTKKIFLFLSSMSNFAIFLIAKIHQIMVITKEKQWKNKYLFDNRFYPQGNKEARLPLY